MGKDYFSNFIKELSFKEQIYEKIKRLIILNRLKPREKLVEVNLSKSMNLSRGPIREALNRLDVEGYVDIIPNKGTIVHNVDQKEISDTFDFFNILYYELIISVIGKISPFEIDRFIEEFIEEFKNTKPDEVSKHDLMNVKINQDNRFYTFLINKNKNKNKVFAKCFTLLHGKIHWYRNISAVERPFENSTKDRLEIYNSIKKKNKGMIYKAVSKNLEDSKKYAVV
jgi:DNA-binding GntR family transcriptional regulator